MVRRSVQAFKCLNEQGAKLDRDQCDLMPWEWVWDTLGSPTDGGCRGLIITNPGASPQPASRSLSG